MAILDLSEKKKSETIDPCMNELTSGGMKIIEAAELILSRVSTKQLKDINRLSLRYKIQSIVSIYIIEWL